jgi:hypothetical protein
LAKQAEHSTPDTKNTLEIKNNNGMSGYSNHILNTDHKYGPIADNMDIVKNTQKRKTHERQCHRAEQPNIQNTTRSRQQIAAQNRQTTKKEQADKHT